MRVLWLNYGLLPDACVKMGYETQVGCGWVQSMLSSLIDAYPQAELCVLSFDWRPCDVQIGHIRYVSFGKGETCFSCKKISSTTQAEIAQIIKDFNPDLIHIHGTEYPYCNFDSIVYCDKPVVVSMQGLVSECWKYMDGGLPTNAFKEIGIIPRAYLKGNSVEKIKMFWKDVRATNEIYALKRWHHFIGRTHWDKSVLLKNNPRALYYHVDEPLRPSFYCGIQRSRIYEHTIFSSASYVYPLKGLHWLFDALAIVKRKFPDVQLRLANGYSALHTKRSFSEWLRADSYQTYLRRQIKTLDIEANLTLLPEIDSGQVRDELLRATVYVSASLCDNSPNALCEAMMLGTPVVHTDVGGVKSLLDNQREGLLVQSCNATALADAIMDVFNRPGSASERAILAQKRARVRHDRGKIGRRLLEVYDSVINFKGVK